MEELLSKIKDIQGNKNLNNSQFAEHIGISRSMWQAISTGNRQIGDKTLNRIIVAFPELSAEILHFIRKKNGNHEKQPPTT
jgi:plasmid maintenance system antidote protein VapI